MALITAIGMSIFTAIAFTTSSAVEHKLTDTSDETQQYQDNLRDYNYQQDIIRRKKQMRLDFINQKMARQSHSVKTFQDVDEANQAYYYATGEKLPDIPNNIFYQSPNVFDAPERNNQYAFIIGVGLISGGLYYYYYRR